MIDNLAPRFEISAETTGAGYNQGGRVYQELSYRYDILDAHLDALRVGGPCQGLVEGERLFGENAVEQALFPDLIQRNGLRYECNRWQPTSAAPSSVSACDIYGNCASASAAPRTVVAQNAAPSAAPQAVIVDPSAGQTIAAGSTFSVTLSAQATAGLKSIVLSIDGAVAQTIDLATAMRSAIRCARLCGAPSRRRAHAQRAS
ncbi:hypothetical protein HC891_20825, partial [Candidatus Gracilibacteria bacterium]|nr:hypothetical protein [Candidatus Gracilibacteria bacterium]